MSVLLPYAVPDRANPFSNAVAGQGCLAGLSGILSLLVIFLVALPLVLPVILGATWLCVFVPPIGFGLAALGRALAAAIGYPRLPEILATVAKTD